MSAAQRQHCKTCGAVPGDRCRTVSGRVTGDHAARQDAAWDAYIAGKPGRPVSEILRLLRQD